LCRIIRHLGSGIVSIIADKLSKAGWSWAAFQPWILAGEQSSLPMHIAAKNGSLCVRINN
jgi:hypothetical protein